MGADEEEHSLLHPVKVQVGTFASYRDNTPFDSYTCLIIFYNTQQGTLAILLCNSTNIANKNEQ